MKAIRIHQFGGPEVLQFEEIAEPQPGQGEIRIRVIAAGVNPADWKMIENPRPGATLPTPVGLDVAGVVDMVGPGVQEFQQAQGVFAKTVMGQGGFAEYTVVNTSQAARKPNTLDFVSAAGVPTAALTAWQALFDIAGLQPGQTVLIHAAAGGVGNFAVQFAKWKGARVIGTASGSHVAFVQSLGADEVIDYTTQQFGDVLKNVDVVLDSMGGETLAQSWQVLKPGGFLVTLVAPIPEGVPQARGVNARQMMAKADGGELAQIAQLIDEGRVKTFVSTVLPLSEARQALEMSKTRHIQGKIVLRVAEDPALRQRAA